eukprot:TRINITY_DN214_c4_g1_i2.p1 TRINITY_DN214_c4_g1~~TRINITY_DN214_c4_g1_i2.p1  ORF type:complete len:374 (-),score=113.77 TRINITY_DN214_c4_g1_i2:238-1359(-)
MLLNFTKNITKIKKPLFFSSLYKKNSIFNVNNNTNNNVFDGFFSMSKLQHPSQTPRIMITGACGQVGTELVEGLREIYGSDNVLATDVNEPKNTEIFENGPFAYANVMDLQTMERLVVEYHINWFINLSGILSAAGEQNPDNAFNVNFIGARNCFELARKHDLRIFAPSSIAAFGVKSPHDMTPDFCIQDPNTIYGISKVYIELMGQWYHEKYGVDFRSLRYPGLISWRALPGGGTTDYAVSIFYDAINKVTHQCFLREDSELPMMHMDDAIKGSIKLLSCPEEKLKQRVFNINGCSFTPSQIYNEIKKHIPDLKIEYKPDFRQKIADSWPNSLDDTEARKQWGWENDFTTENLVVDMLENIEKKIKNEKNQK